MNVLKQYITFLKEYKKLLERGVKDIFSSSVSNSFIWVDEICEFVESGISKSTLTQIFSADFKRSESVFSLEKPLKPVVAIPEYLLGRIVFNEAKNKFESVIYDEIELENFHSSENGKSEIEKINKFKRSKDVYSKLYRAHNDLRNDSNLEIVLSVGLIQYSKTNHNGNLSKVNQHLFHFPLSIEINADNKVVLSFSNTEDPYADFFFLNNTPIEKDVLTNVIDRFEQKVFELGYEYIFEIDFKDLIEKSLQQISSNSEFEKSIYKPKSDYFREDYFKILFSPAINIKQRKPRFFEKLTDSIISYSQTHEVEAPLFNLLARNPDLNGKNAYPKANYFKDELYESNKENVKNLNKEDFSVFFPLPFNKEQKQIYENYLNNRLTVVTGPPGTGKSHTIVNILCSLLAQGKRVLVTAQTDKALESLLDKIPKTFDDLIFTKIQLETDCTRFSLEKSIENIAKILTENFYSNIESKISELDHLKAEYVKLKFEITQALEREYSLIQINTSFRGLRPYQIFEKFELKDSREWSWIRDEVNEEMLSSFELIRLNILRYKELSNVQINYGDYLDVDFSGLIAELKRVNFNNILNLKESCKNQLNQIGLTEYSKEKVLKIELDKIVLISSEFSSSDIVINNIKELEHLQNQLKEILVKDNLTSNKPFSDLCENGTKYLLDIETYLSFSDKGSVGLFTRLSNSNFKKVLYLEQFAINGKRCNTKSEILQLKQLIESLLILNENFNLLKQVGYKFSFDDNSNLLEKTKVLNDVLRKVEINKKIITKIQFDPDFINFSDYCHIDLFNIDALGRKAIQLKEDFNKLKNLDKQLADQNELLQNIDSYIEESIVKEILLEFLPISKIDSIQKFENFKNRIFEIADQIEIGRTFTNLRDSLSNLFPNTFESLVDIPDRYISKENFEYAAANDYLQQNEFIDLQKCKEEISFVNNKILEVKRDILFDLSKSNFKNKFEVNELDDFINLLKQYKINLEQGRRGIKNNTRFQVLARQNSIAISKKLSCWVMKFNDVLNSLGEEPEIFDCIIVDEASQLDFNSLILGYYAKNMIIVGDDKQTSPSSLTGTNNDAFESIKNKYLDYLGNNILHIRSDLSLFSLAGMIAGTANLQLKEHFRCVPELIEFSKKEFYNNSLRPLKQINSNRLNPKEAVFVNDAYTESQVVQKEVEEIKQFLQKILNNPLYETKTIGVVSLGTVNHTEKLKDIKEELVIEFGNDKLDMHKLIIEDSPKFQGDERDVMIVSLGVALDFQKIRDNQNAKPRAIINDNDDLKKINVALSRAKEQMILFHSVKSEHLQPNDFRNKILAFFYDEVVQISPLIIEDFKVERNRHNVPEPFDSWFEYDIAKSVIEKGYVYIQPQFKVKEPELFFNHKLGKHVYINFKIDLVVHNNGKLVAIECDGDPYHSAPEDVAYDVERQEFLERVGWKVYRVLYSAFKRSPKEEIDKIIDFIELYTKKDDSTFLKISAINGKFTNEVSFEDESNFFESKVDIITLEQERVICYFNLFNDNTYRIQDYVDESGAFCIPILERHKDGFLLQCYDNGHINKVFIRSILSKKKNYQYLNGKNPSASILYIKVIEEDTLIALKLIRGNDIVFKAHKTESISNRDLLHLQGYKVVYQDYDHVEFKVLPKSIYHDIKRLVFSSFTAEGKSVYNKYYDSEWSIVKRFIPNLSDFDIHSKP